MFLDDKLTELFDTGIANHKEIVDICQDLIDECVSRIPNPSTVSVGAWINSVKCVENGWKLFCKRSKVFKPTAFKDVMLNRTGGIDNEDYIPIYEALGWLNND